MSEDEAPHVPLPFPYVFGAPPSLPVERRFAHSSSASTRKHERTADSGDESDGLEDPLDLDQYLGKREEVAVKPNDGNRELEEDNLGAKMLARMGWNKGEGLGKAGTGRLVPVAPAATSGFLGLGKAGQETRMLDSTTLQTRELTSQRIARETDDQRNARMLVAKQRASVQQGIAETLAKFNCDLCGISYKNYALHDEHLNSYGHHHRARERALQIAERDKKGSSGETDRIREKERKREAKELLRQMGAAGVALPVAALPAPVKVKVEVAPTKGRGWAKFAPDGEAKLAGVSAGASNPATTSTAPIASSGGFKKSGWAVVGAKSTSASTLPPAPANVVPVKPDATVTPNPLSPVAGPPPIRTTGPPRFQSAGYLAPPLAAEEGPLSPLASYSQLPPPIVAPLPVAAPVPVEPQAGRTEQMDWDGPSSGRRVQDTRRGWRSAPDCNVPTGRGGYDERALPSRSSQQNSYGYDERAPRDSRQSGYARDEYDDGRSERGDGSRSRASYNQGGPPRPYSNNPPRQFASSYPPPPSSSYPAPPPLPGHPHPAPTGQYRPPQRYDSDPRGDRSRDPQGEDYRR